MLSEKEIKEIEKNYDFFRERGELYLDPSKNKEFKLFDVVIGISPSQSITSNYKPVRKNEPLINIGYIVQIREKVGIFGSDFFFIRNPNGDLVSHQNQAFIKLNEEDSKFIMSFYDPDIIKHDANEQTYTFNKKYPRKGFFINKTDYDEQYEPDPSFTICMG